MQKNVLQYLEQTACRLPEKICLTDGVGGASLTFSALLHRARCIGSALLRAGMTGGARVALLCDRHPATVAAMFGVTYAGGCYVPLDPAMPAARRDRILDTTGAAFLLCDAANRAAAAQLTAGLRVLTLEETETAKEDAAALARVRAAQLDTDLLYLIFTSGSTGEPKGVAACHRSVLDYAEALTAALPFREDSVFGCQSPLFFDAPLKELLSTVKLGATTCFLPRRLFSFPPLLLRALRENGINTVCWVSGALSTVAALGALEQEPPTGLRLVVFGSEALPLAHYRRWRAALPDAAFYQLYGPTEATGMSCYWKADRPLADGEPIPIGRPFDNTGLLLLNDRNGRILPCAGCDSEEGEIVLRGTCVTAGYYRNAAATAAAFVQNPLQDAYPETVFRTGDRARYNGRGELIFLGRRDTQIKRMGHRIELGEIEQNAASLPGIGGACCVATTDSRLVLFYTGDRTEGAVRDALAVRLPRYMLPTDFLRLPAFPRLPNGKTDRRALGEAAARYRNGQGETSND